MASALNSGVHDDLDPTTKTVYGHSVVLVAEALVGMVAPADPGRNHGWAQRVCHCCRYDAADIEKVMHPFQVVHLAAEKLQVCRQRLQYELVGKCEVER